MKNTILFILLLSILTINSVCAQCVNGTDTDPSNPFPVGAGFKTNTFNWQQNPIPITGKFVTDLTLDNPFYNVVDYLKPLQGGLKSDSKVTDGWELVKQDFGYAYANNSWRGRTIFDATGGSRIKAVAYMMLYNKYSGTLRIVGIVDGTKPQDQIVVNLSLIKANKEVLNLSRFKFNALFNRYNAREAALDRTTDLTTIKALAQVPATKSDFFYADFQVSYDPCICFFESALKVEFRVLNTSTLKLTGRILGQTVDIAEKNKTPEDYLTTVLNQNGLPERPYNQQYYNIELLRREVQQKSAEAENAYKTVISALSKAAKLAKLFVGGAGIFDKIEDAYKDRSGQLTDMFDFLSFFSTDTKAVNNPSVITAEVAAVGEVQDIAILNGTDFSISIPGSKDADLSPEYPSSPAVGEGVKPMYPMYNERLGRFVLIKTPEIQYSICPKRQTTAYNSSNIYTYKFADEFPTFTYAFNPIVDAEKTKIFVAIQYKDSLTPMGPLNIVTQYLPIENARNLISEISIYTGVPYRPIEDKFTVVFQIFYQFKPDRKGDIKFGYDLVKFKPNVRIVSPSINLCEDYRYLILSNTPTDLKLGATTFTEARTIYSFGDITITGDFINNSNTPIVIIAQSQVNISPNVNIIGNIEIRSGQVLPPGFPVDLPIPPMTFAEIQNFCTQGEYKAKDQTKPLVDEPPTEEKTIANKKLLSNTSFTVSPNPFTTQVAVDFGITAPTDVTLELTNAIGQVIKTINLGAKDEGNYQQIIETADLARGLYLLTLRTEQGIETKKLVKQ
jgi:hypothetical protein